MSAPKVARPAAPRPDAPKMDEIDGGDGAYARLQHLADALAADDDVPRAAVKYLGAVLKALADSGELLARVLDGSALIVELDARRGCDTEQLGSGVQVTRNGAGTIMSVLFAPNTVSSVQADQTEPER